MKSSLILGLASIALSLSGCTEKNQDAIVDPWVTFDLRSDRLGSWPAAGFIHSISNLVGAGRESVAISFVSDDRMVHFEVILSEPRDEYDLKPITRDEKGNWIYPKTPASPPGEIELSWVTVGTEGITLGVNELTDHEFVEWLESYAKTLETIEERSALVIDAEPTVTCERLFTVFTMLNEKNLDRILVERRAESDVAIQEPPAPSSTNLDLD
jgi:hypothetical protein